MIVYRDCPLTNFVIKTSPIAFLLGVPPPCSSKLDPRGLDGELQALLEFKLINSYQVSA